MRFDLTFEPWRSELCYENHSKDDIVFVVYQLYLSRKYLVGKCRISKPSPEKGMINIGLFRLIREGASFGVRLDFYLRLFFCLKSWGWGLCWLHVRCYALYILVIATECLLFIIRYRADLSPFPVILCILFVFACRFWQSQVCSWSFIKPLSSLGHDTFLLTLSRLALQTNTHNSLSLSLSLSLSPLQEPKAYLKTILNYSQILSFFSEKIEEPWQVDQTKKHSAAPWGNYFLLEERGRVWLGMIPTSASFQFFISFHRLDLHVHKCTRWDTKR